MTKRMPLHFGAKICAACINMAGGLFLHWRKPGRERNFFWDVAIKLVRHKMCCITSTTFSIWTCFMSFSFYPVCHCRICPAWVFRAPCCRCLSPKGSTSASPEGGWTMAWTLNAPQQSLSFSWHHPASFNVSSAKGKRMKAASLS